MFSLKLRGEAPDQGARLASPQNPSPMPRRWTETLLHLSTAAGFVAIARYLHVKLAKARKADTHKRRCLVAARVKAQLPEAAQKVHQSDEAVTATHQVARELASGVERLSQAMGDSGKGLEHTFARAALKSSWPSPEARAVGELFVAWREVGEAESVLASRLGELCAKLQSAISEAETEGAKQRAQGEELMDLLVDAEMEDPPGESKQFFALRRANESMIAEAQKKHQMQRDAKWIEACARYEKLAEELETGRARFGDTIVEAVAEVRRLPKGVSERLATLRPSWRGSKSRQPSITGRQSSAESPKRVSALIKSLSTAEGRLKHQEAEAAREALYLEENPSEQQEPLDALPIEEIDAGEWRIYGIYEHQALKVGLRALDTALPKEDLQEIGGKKGTPAIFRRKILQDLLSGSIRLQSVPASDIAAAQPDLRQLTLRQLLRLRVLHLDYVPSGCGADTVHAAGATHEAFMVTLDSRLFELLGQTVFEKVVPGIDNFHKCGREAALLAAASQALPQQRFWAWWLMGEHRVFFDGSDCSATAKFPEHRVLPSKGVVEVADQSKPDRHEPSGRLRWLDWKIDRVTNKKDLSACPPSPSKDKSSLDDGSPFCRKGSNGLEADSRESSPIAARAGTAGMFSPALLKEMRGSLRKSKTLPADFLNQDELGPDDD